jgi:hypothetical protein
LYETNLPAVGRVAMMGVCIDLDQFCGSEPIALLLAQA